jgi:hypothetical protein
MRSVGSHTPLKPSALICMMALDGEADAVVVENSQVTCPDELTNDGTPEFLHKAAKSKHRHFCYLLCFSRRSF